MGGYLRHGARAWLARAGVGASLGLTLARPPSLARRDWPYAGDRLGLRRQVYRGSNAGMPHWGLVGPKPRDVDAVATYIETVIRSGLDRAPAGP
ncbi:MAG TPA: hypothetical protein VMK65_01515 [Longimicrobiales bacterium]|nr:hypothetical protein [Longimicrobiales bacterium]